MIRANIAAFMIVAGCAVSVSAQPVVTDCDKCPKLEQQLAEVEKRRADAEAAHSRLEAEHLRAISNAQRAGEEHRQFAEQVKAAGDLASADAKTRLAQLEGAARGAWDLAFELGIKSHDEAYNAKMWSQIAGELRDALDKCRATCPLQQPSKWYLKPWPYFAAAGAGGAAALAGGGNNPTETINTPSAPQQQTLTTPQAPQTPQTPARRPAALLTVSGCACINNSANLDGILQLCQHLHQIRTTGSGNTITLGGDAPLPTFQGTFSDATGEFELSTTTTIGTTTSNVVLAGTVEPTGNIHNLRIGFFNTGGQLTLYTLTLTVPQ